jgi:hypothetical protein
MNAPRRGQLRLSAGPLLGVLILGCVACHHPPKSPQATASDVEAAQQDAKHEIEQARVEAAKDVKSAVKTMGADSPNVAAARATGAYDVAMARADGDHKVAIEKCMTLQEPSAQQPCKDQADDTYRSAAAAAKAIRVSHHQP